MNDWFSWNGVRSTEYGVYVEKLPPVTIAKERTSYEEVTGRSGSITMLEGDCVYEDVVLAMDCWMREGADASAIAAWLRGNGKLRMPNRPNGYYVGRLNGQIEMDKVIPARDHRRFTLIWRCRPFLRLDDPEVKTYATSGGILQNPGTAPGLARITITGSGYFSMTIGMQTVFFRGVEGGIILDPELCDAFTLDGALLANDWMDGDFFDRIQPGENAVSWLTGGENDDGTTMPGSISSVKIEPVWRCY